jgi:hypothetical protein
MGTTDGQLFRLSSANSALTLSIPGDSRAEQRSRSRRSEAAVLGQLNNFMDGSVTVHSSQKISKIRVAKDLQRGFRGDRRFCEQSASQSSPPADDAVNDFLTKPAVHRASRAESAFQNVFDEVALGLVSLEDPQLNFSWFCPFFPRLIWQFRQGTRVLGDYARGI